MKIKYVISNNYKDFLEYCRMNGLDKRKVKYIVKLEDLYYAKENEVAEHGLYWKNPVWGQWADLLKKIKQDN